MAFASYTNADRGNLSAVLGQFKEKDYGNWFEFTNRNAIDKESYAPEYPHRVFVGVDNTHLDDTRIARVLKTVAYVVVDIDMNGEPVVEKWYIKNFREYGE